MKTKEKQKNRTSLNEMFYNKKTQRLEKIDNRLVRKERRLENVNNKTKIQFNDLTQEDDLLVLQEEECKLSMKLLGKKEKEQTKFAARHVKQLQDKKVIYEDVFEDSDVEYEILEDKKIKENIVIRNNNKETYEYQYLLTLENLTLKQEQNTKTLQFVNEKGKALFTIIEPVMFDSSDSSSNDIAYEVKHLEENKYLLTLKADESWINSKERVLPIYLDPTLLITSPQLFTWYIIEPYNECVSYESQYSGPILNYGDYAVMSLDTELLGELTRGFDISSFKVWIWTSQAREKVYLHCTDVLPSDLKAENLDDCNPAFLPLDQNYSTPTYSDGAYFNLFNIKDMVKSGKRTFIFRCDIDSSETYDVLTVLPSKTSYELAINYEFPLQLTVDENKKNNFDTTKFNGKVTISKCLLTNEFKMNVLDLEKFNKIILSHIYSTSTYLSTSIKETLFSQYGENFRINYSYLLYDARNKLLTQNGITYGEGDFILLDPNESFVKYIYREDSYYNSNDYKQKLVVNDENIVIFSPTNKMTFVKSSLTDFYLLSSIEDLIYGQCINIMYNDDKVTISSIEDEKSNKLDFNYDENGLLSSIDKNGNEYMILEYQDGILNKIEYNDYDSRILELEYQHDNISIYDSYDDVDVSIQNDVNYFEIYDCNLGEIVKTIEYFDGYRIVTNRYGEQQILVFEDYKVISSYTLKSTSTEDNVVLYSNVNYSLFEESVVEEKNGSTTITTIKENGSLNINNNNLTTDSQFNGERYNCDLFNGKNVFYLSKSDNTTSVIECTLTEAQLSRITKGSYYTFGIFFKSLSESVIKTSISITLLNGSNEIASKTFSEIKPIWDFKFLSFKYFELDNTISTLKIKIEVFNYGKVILFANPILRKDSSYANTKSVFAYDEEDGKYKTTNINIANNFKKTDKYDEYNLLTNSIIEDLHSNTVLSNESYTYNSKTYQLLNKTYSNDTKLMNRNNIENIYLSNKLVKTNIYSSKEGNKIIQNRYNFDAFGNINPKYDERGSLIEESVFNNDGTISSKASSGLINFIYEYNEGVLSKISSENDMYSVDLFFENGLIYEITLNNDTTYFYNYDYEDESCSVELNGTVFSYNKLEREANKISVIEKIGSHFERKYVYNLEEKLTSYYENDILKTSCVNNDYGQTAMFKEIIDDDTNIIKRYYYFDDDREKARTINYNGLYTLSVTNEKYNYTDCSQSSSVVLGGVLYSYKYTYNNNFEKILTKIEYPNTEHTIDYNGFGNIEKQITINGPLKITNTYVYQNVASSDDKIRTSNYVESVSQVTKYNEEEKSNSNIIHSYNPNGTISYINIGGETYTFTYDLFGRLNKEISSFSGISKEYTYDNNGNVTYIIETSESNQVNVSHQTFNSKNELETVTYQDGSYIEITYDEIGNPLLISKNGFCESGTGLETENIALTYEKGNRLSTYGTNITFKYDLSGTRISKQVGNELHKYYIHNGNILREEVTNVITGLNIYTLDFYYDESGVCSFKHNNTMYYYQKDLTGSIIGIYNDIGELLVKYRYDAWGNHKVYNQLNQETTIKSFVGNVNPFRYKGYYYDMETGLAMVGQRYYSPELCRFIQPADISSLNPRSINGLNPYSYANNNPISIAYSSSGAGASVANQLINQNFSLLKAPNLGINKNNYSSSVHWKNEWFATDWPSFLVFSKTKGALLDWELSIYKGSLYFDEAENHSIYIGVGNISTFVGYNVEEDKYGVFADANVLSVGYDGRYIDAEISVVGVGFILGWEDKKFRFKIDPPGWFGFDISIDFGQIIKDIFGWEW